MKSREPTPDRAVEEIVSASAEETQNIGAELARRIPVPGVVLLRGDLGAGKTTLTRGIACGLGLEDPSLVRSPSFTLVHTYQGDCPIYHVDLYRLRGARDLYSIGIDDFLGREGVTVIEWGERLPYAISGAVEIEIEDAGDQRRILRVSFPGPEAPRRRHRPAAPRPNRERPKGCAGP